MWGEQSPSAHLNTNKERMLNSSNFGGENIYLTNIQNQGLSKSRISIKNFHFDFLGVIIKYFPNIPSSMMWLECN